MKRIVYGIFIAVLFAGFLFTSCDCDDGTSTGDGDDGYLCDMSIPVVLGGDTIPLGLGDFFLSPDDPLNPDYDEDEEDESY